MQTQLVTPAPRRNVRRFNNDDMRRECARHGPGFRAGPGYRAGPTVTTTPLTILGSLAWWVRSDLGITIATGVSAWADQSGNGINFAQGTGASQPALVSAVLNGKDAVRFDGSNDYLDAAWTRSAPGTQPLYVWLVYSLTTWVSNDSIICDGSSTTGMGIRCRTATPELRMHNTTLVNANTAAALSTPARLEMQYGNSTSDYLKIIGTSVTGANAGNSAGVGTVALGAQTPAAGEAACDIYEAFAFLGTPSAGQRTELDAYCTARYGAGLV